MPRRDIIVIGASAGGIEALRELVSGLPRDLPAAVFVVLHIAPTGATVLPSILSRAGKIPARHAGDGETVQHGIIYVSQPDRHLVLREGKVILGKGPKENSTRPAIDPLFRTAARSYNGRVIGVVLSGMLDDGTAGLATIKQRGGLAVVQDPETALFSGMPRSAIEHVEVDHVVPIAEIPRLLRRLVEEPFEQKELPVEEKTNIEADLAELEPQALDRNDRPGEPSVFTCPECHGTLFELNDGKITRFRCRVGHAYNAQTLLSEQGSRLEAALWTAMVALRERSQLAERLAQRARQRGHDISAAHFDGQARSASDKAELIRQALADAPTEPPQAQPEDAA